MEVKKLSKAQFEKARKFMYNNAQDIELRTRLMGDGELISLLDDDWGTESAYKLCCWIDTPNHPYYPLYKKAVDDNHTFLVENQNEDGSWFPSWSWGEPEIWEGAERHLKGMLTMRFLWSLGKFYRCGEFFNI